MISRVLRLGTRRSPLALWQAEWARQALARRHPGMRSVLVPMMTAGDRVPGALAEHGGKGLFVKELDRALLRGEIDVGVHSLKDIPGQLADGVVIAAVSARANPFDVLISHQDDGWAGLPAGARVGSSSPRRSWQLRAVRPDVQILPLRGNVETRLRHLASGAFDAILLAAAGLERLGLRPAHATTLPVADMIPAVGQGVIAITACADDSTTRAALQAACHDAATAVCVAAERALLAAIGGDCFTPLAGFCTQRGDTLQLHAFLAEPDGTHPRRVACAGDAQHPEPLGQQVAAELRQHQK